MYAYLVCLISETTIRMNVGLTIMFKECSVFWPKFYSEIVLSQHKYKNLQMS